MKNLCIIGLLVGITALAVGVGMLTYKPAWAFITFGTTMVLSVAYAWTLRPRHKIPSNIPSKNGVGVATLPPPPPAHAMRQLR